MSLIRFQLDLAIPESVFDKIPLAKRQAFRDAVQAIKAFAVRLNGGMENEEFTVTASLHICRHDEGEGCEPDELNREI